MVQNHAFSYMIIGMNEYASLPYIEGRGKPKSIPFERYLPELPAGLIQSWLERHNPAKEWMLEPISAAPAAILEAASSGFPVLACVNNPVIAFEIKLLAQAPKQKEFQSVLHELGSQKKGSERLSTHINNLYLTRCASCGTEVPADYLIWRKAEGLPVIRSYRCQSCGDEGEHAITPNDLERLVPFKRSDPLHRARALERVPGGTREARQNLEDILNIYSERQLYALFTLINKVEGMDLSPQRRGLIDALLLSALDAGHNLWSMDEERNPPRMLNTPAEYVERNLWRVLETSVEEWCTLAAPIALAVWPEFPQKDGICLYQGRMRDLARQKSPFQIRHVACVLPRPSQTFWTLSTLWSSWLWGKENAATIKNVLERQRFDWYWHTNALQSALAPAAQIVEAGSTVFALMPEAVPGFISAAFEACSASNLAFSGTAYKDETLLLQTEWKVQPGSRDNKKLNLHRIIREALHEVLTQSGEPIRYLKLYAAVNAALSANLAFPPTIQQLTYETANQIHNEIAKVFSDRHFLRRLDATSQDLESGLWWLVQPEGSQASLADRVEIEVVQCLQKNGQIGARELHDLINARFTGFLTPPQELLAQCLNSYARYDSSSHSWTLKENEQAIDRKRDLDEIQNTLDRLAGKIGMHAEGECPILWSDPRQADRLAYRLFVSSSALLGRFINEEADEGVENVFLFPGSRSGLLRYKLDRDPYLREKTAQRWHLLKFRTLREVDRRNDLSKDLWDLFIDSDPISLQDATQLSMFL